MQAVVFVIGPSDSLVPELPDPVVPDVPGVAAVPNPAPHLGQVVAPSGTSSLQF